MLYSIRTFIAVAVIAAVQLVPIVGQLLMPLALPFWSVVLVNAAFILIAYEALTGRTGRWALVFPVLWFGGYAVATTVSHIHADQLLSEVRQANLRKIMAFDPQSQDLVLHLAGSDQTLGSLQPRTMVLNYRLERVFS